MSGQKFESGLAVKLSNFSVKGLVCAVPKEEIQNDAFYEKFGEAAVTDIVKMIGVHSRRKAHDDQTAADLCQSSAEALLNDLGWSRDSVDALIFVTQTPDYRLPATACALQGRLKLSKSCIAFDVNLGCSGYVYGLWLAAKLLDSQSVKRVLLLAGETPSKIIDPNDRATALLFGDAGSATALEFDEDAEDAHFILGTDGGGERHLMIAEGASKKYNDDDPRLKNTDTSRLFMDGGEVFNFTLRSVPPLVNDLLAFSGRDKAEVNAFLFHQANNFMLKHIIKKTKLPVERAPINIDRFGNTSSATIPLLITDQLPSIPGNGGPVAMIGFGVGYSWSAALVDLDSLAVNKLIEI
ncbi:ketoacyl-ACP synthase III [Undibacterium sp. TJN25]|uniref:ketoacyl-ACP synthase III n=1 Tax=Undibacterium sp. TJN25 TaxID=3413056 RepID=UPI003BF2273E